METWDCLSCGAHAQTKAFCEACGAAKAVDGADNALSLMLGLVCDNCDAYNDPGVAVCASCGKPLGAVDDAGAPAPAVAADAVAAVPQSAGAVAAADIDISAILPPRDAAPVLPPSWMTPPTGSPLATQFAMKKVDIGVAVKSEAGAGAGLAAPIPTPAPSIPAVQAKPVSTSLGVPSWTAPPTPAAGVPAPKANVTIPPSAQMPAPAQSTSPRPCAKCNTPLAADDRFCRNCGTRVGEIPASAPMNTGQISISKMPGPGITSNPNLPSPILPQNATMVMPAMHAAQLGPPAAAPSAPAGGAAATLFFGAVQTERSAKLVLVRGQSAYGSQWRLQAVETVIGRSDGMVLFPDDDTLAAKHCRLVFKSGDLWLEPENTTNGVFVRLRDPVSLVPGDEVVVGAQRLRVLADTDRPMHMSAIGDTRVLGSLVKPAPPISLMRVAPDPTQNEVYHRHQRLLTMGRNNCDVNFPRDSFVSERHAQFTHDGNGLVLEDLRSRNGTYVRARAATRLLHGDLVLLGDKVLRVELPR